MKSAWIFRTAAGAATLSIALMMAPGLVGQSTNTNGTNGTTNGTTGTTNDNHRSTGTDTNGTTGTNTTDGTGTTSGTGTNGTDTGKKGGGCSLRVD